MQADSSGMWGQMGMERKGRSWSEDQGARQRAGSPSAINPALFMSPNHRGAGLMSGSRFRRGSSTAVASPFGRGTASPSPQQSPVQMFVESYLSPAPLGELDDALLLPESAVGDEVLPLTPATPKLSRLDSEDWHKPRKTSPVTSKETLVGVMYGFVNFVICVPTLISYAQIVFNEPIFKPFIPMLVKLYFLSSAIHQLVFTARSKLEFAVGQVQDVGLIFLAAMVRNIVSWGATEGHSDDAIMATCLWQCSLSTTIVGVFVILVGKLNLSEYVQMLPKPVVGGYLGYIGYFCFVAGLQIVTDLQLQTPALLLQLYDWDLVYKLALLAVFTAILCYVNFFMESELSMPVALTVLPLLFWLAITFLGVSEAECQQGGWLPKPTKMASGLDVFKLFNTEVVGWHHLLTQGLSVFGLIVVVTFGSSLDVAAVQEARPADKLDYNNELITVGLGNLLSGVTGGATGSYIFSQTIFSAKKGVRSRWNGIIVCAGEFLLFFAPIDIVHFLPNAYTGAIMCLFGIDIMSDWLIFSRKSMASIEYAVVWVSFAIVMWFTAIDSFGVIEGILVSSVVAAFVFSVNYSRAHTHWQPLRHQSSINRPWRSRQALSTVQGRIFSVGLSGYAFFLSSMNMAKGIEAEALRRRPRFVVIDFSRLQGLDSTAASQLKYLVSGLERDGMKVFLSGINAPWLHMLLEAQGLLEGEEVMTERCFETLDLAIQFCEEVFLWELHVRPTSEKSMERPLDKLLLEYVEGSSGQSTVSDRDKKAAAELSRHFERVQLRAGDILCRKEDKADNIYFVASGLLQASSVLSNLSSSKSFTQAAGQGGTFWDPGEKVGVGGILGNTPYHFCSRYGIDISAGEDGVVVRQISRRKIEELEVTSPHLVAFLRMVLLRDLAQYQVQFLEAEMATSGVM